METTRGLGGVIGAILWFLMSDFVGGIAGLAAGWMAMTFVEPVLGDLAGGVLLVSVPLGLCAGGLLGVASLGWLAECGTFEASPALSNS